MEMTDEIFFDTFEINETWQLYVFSRICEDLEIITSGYRYFSDSKIIVARVEGNSKKLGELNFQWAKVLKYPEIEVFLNEMVRLLLKKIGENDESF